MKCFLLISLILNFIIILCEFYTLSRIKNKKDILKYYTYLQNLLALITSVIFIVCLLLAIFLNEVIPETVKGFRYVTTCGLITTMYVYIIFLSKNDKNVLSENDFIGNFNPKIANFILHYFCPLISLVSFVIFERQIDLNSPEWTGYVAIPSSLYWTLYLILTTAKLWDEPYHFSSPKGKKNNVLIDIAVIASLPLSFILISVILWNIK